MCTAEAMDVTRGTGTVTKKFEIEAIKNQLHFCNCMCSLCQGRGESLITAPSPVSTAPKICCDSPAVLNSSENICHYLVLIYVLKTFFMYPVKLLKCRSEGLIDKNID